MLAQRYSFLFFPSLCPASRLGLGRKLGGDTARTADSEKGYSVPCSILVSSKSGVVEKEGSEGKELPSKVAVALQRARHQSALFFFSLFWSPIKLLSRTVCCLAFAFPILSPVL